MILIQHSGLFFDSTIGEKSYRKKWGKKKGVTLPIHLSYQIESVAPPTAWKDDGDYETFHQLTADGWKELFGNLRRDIEKPGGKLKNVFQFGGVKEVLTVGQWPEGTLGSVELTMHQRDKELIASLIINGNFAHRGSGPLESVVDVLDLMLGNPEDKDKHSSATFARWSDLTLSAGEIHTPLWEVEPEPPQTGDDLANLRRYLEQTDRHLQSASTNLAEAFELLEALEHADQAEWTGR